VPTADCSILERTIVLTETTKKTAVAHAFICARNTVSISTARVSKASWLLAAISSSDPRETKRKEKERLRRERRK
jgi:hypothetical protein